MGGFGPNRPVLTRSKKTSLDPLRVGCGCELPPVACEQVQWRDALLHVLQHAQGEPPGREKTSVKRLGQTFVFQVHGSFKSWILYYWSVVNGTSFIFPYIWNVIIPMDELIFFRGVEINHPHIRGVGIPPPTRFIDYP